MSEFDSDFEAQNRELFTIINDNPRRRGVIRDVGVIVTIDQARKFAVYEAAQSRESGGIGSLILAAAALLVMVTITILALA